MLFVNDPSKKKYEDLSVDILLVVNIKLNKHAIATCHLKTLGSLSQVGTVLVSRGGVEGGCYYIRGVKKGC